MKYLYLDDIRFPKTDEDWIIVRSYYGAVEYVKRNGIPDFISFDNDLGLGKEGYDFAVWLTEQDMDGTYTFPDNFEFFVHSANPVRGPEIHYLLTNYLNFKRSNI